MQEIFKKRLDEIIEGLEGVAKSADNFLVHGKDTEEHDWRMQALLEKLEENGVTLNNSIYQFHTTELDFLNHRISPQGIQPLNDKLDAIRKFRNQPTSQNLGDSCWWPNS